jgi:hypothetical protein
MSPPRNIAIAGEEQVVRDAFLVIGPERSFIPPEFHEVVDVAECALDEHLELFQRHYAAASRAASRARCEVEQLEARDDIHPNVLSQAQRQRAAAETRSQQLLRAIDALEDRFETRPESE